MRDGFLKGALILVVMGTKNATKALKDRQLVTVNGMKALSFIMNKKDTEKFIHQDVI